MRKAKPPPRRSLIFTQAEDFSFRVTHMIDSIKKFYDTNYQFSLTRCPLLESIVMRFQPPFVES